jgi:hypothetical protein
MILLNLSIFKIFPLESQTFVSSAKLLLSIFQSNPGTTASLVLALPSWLDLLVHYKSNSHLATLLNELNQNSLVQLFKLKQKKEESKEKNAELLSYG